MPPETAPGIVCERADGLVRITIDRPDRKNALDSPTWQALLAALREVAASRDDRVLVLEGAGDDFCAGADLKEDPFADGPPPHALATMETMNAVVLTLHRLPQPTIAKVRGAAVGGGCSLAAACDLVMAGKSARFGLTFARVALSIDVGGSWTLPRRIGLTRAKELLLLSRMIDAREAAEIGLVTRVLGDDILDAEVAVIAKELASAAPIALRQTKRLLNNSMTATMEQALDDEASAQAVNMKTKDFREAIAAFADRRPPRFIGR